jgi:hydrogenase expression/formation protein HypD
VKYVDEYRDRSLVESIAQEIHDISIKPVRLMEVCGGHTMSIHRFGLPSLLPGSVTLLSGPGCPVCVTERGYIDRAIAFARLPDVIITTYGDLIRVPGSSSSLEAERSSGRDIRIVYSTLEALAVARENPGKKVIFLGIGFETTSPASAAAIIRADEEGLENFYLYSSHKVMPPAMSALIDEGVSIDGYICPGHVSTITGPEIYEQVVSSYNLGCVISGFEPVDLMQSILMLVRQFESGKAAVEIEYKRFVKPGGNRKALAMLDQVFEPADEWWRGLGVLPGSGMTLRNQYERFDAQKQIPVEVEATRQDKGCICGTILKGLAQPHDCGLFAKACTPENPVGACMVSSEGACAAFYRYDAHE